LKEALAFAQGCWAAKLKATSLRVFTPIDDLKASETSIFAVLGEVERA
jgi:hypothetical protein